MYLQNFEDRTNAGPGRERLRGQPGRGGREEAALRGFLRPCAAFRGPARPCAALRARGGRWQQIFMAGEEAEPVPFPLPCAAAAFPGEGVLPQAMSRGPAERCLCWVVPAGEIASLLSVVLF